MVGPHFRWRLFALLVATALTVACRGEQTTTISDLASLEELKGQFNQDAGKPRIVLLLSPT